MGNSLIGAYDRQFNRNAVVEWEKANRKQSGGEDLVAKPLQAPYPPSEIKVQNPVFVHDIFPPAQRGYISMHTYSLSSQNPNHRNKFIQTHNLHNSMNNHDDILCPVVITSRTLEPVRVGTGVVLTKVVQVLEDYPITNHPNYAYSSSAFNKNRIATPRAPVSSPDVQIGNFRKSLRIHDIPEDSEEGIEDKVDPRSLNINSSLANTPKRVRNVMS